MNSQSVSTNLIITLMGVVITLAVLFSISHALRKHCSSEYINGIYNGIVEYFPENESIYHDMDLTQITKS